MLYGHAIVIQWTGLIEEIHEVGLNMTAIGLPLLLL